MNAIVDRAAEEAGRDRRRSCGHRACRSPSRGTRSGPRSTGWPAGGIGYLMIEWPSEGRAALEEFLEQVLPTLA